MCFTYILIIFVLQALTGTLCNLMSLILYRGIHTIIGFIFGVLFSNIKRTLCTNTSVVCIVVLEKNIIIIIIAVIISPCVTQT